MRHWEKLFVTYMSDKGKYLNINILKALTNQ